MPQPLSFSTPLPGRSERGNTLLLALVFMALLAMIGMTAMQSSTLEARMAFNMRDRGFAFQAAEDALKAAEQRIMVSPLSQYGSVTGLYDLSIGAAARNPFQADAWTSESSLAATLNNPKISNPPRYYIEYLGYQPFAGPCSMLGENRCAPTDTPMFRIVARGTGASDNTEVILEAYFSR